MKKVIHVITDTNIGGAGIMLLNFLDHHDKHAFDVLIIIPTNSLLKNELIKRKIKLIEVDGIAEKSLSVQSIQTLLKIYKKEKPHIVHTHASFSARISARMYRNCRIISTRHSTFDIPKYKTIFPVKQMLGAINNTFSDAIIAVAPAVKENIVSAGTNPKKVTILPNGTNQTKKLSAEEKNSIRKNFALKDTDFVCAIIARLEKVKGHEDVLRACELLQKYDPNIKVLIAGSGSQESNLKDMAKNLKLTNCIFTGFVKEIYKIENIMDLQLNASYGTEACSLSLLEGMSLGVPAVVSDFGGNPFVIEDGVNGLVFPKRNPQKLYESIVELKQNKDLYNQMSANSQRIYCNKFTAQAMTQKIQKMYSDI